MNPHSIQDTPNMNNTTEINNVLRKLESTKYKLLEIVTELEDLEEKVNKLANKLKENN